MSAVPTVLNEVVPNASERIVTVTPDCLLETAPDSVA